MMTYDEMYVMKGGGDEYELGAVSFDELFCDVLYGGGVVCCCRICMFAGGGDEYELGAVFSASFYGSFPHISSLISH
jgi:hypothetical protein